MEFVFNQSISFVLGVIASLVAAHLYGKIILSMEKRPTLNIEGVWGEYVPKSTGRNYTVGKIYLDTRRKIFAFDGTNYHNDGRAFCHFETVASYVDRDNKRFYYIFSAHVEGDLQKTYFGFGAVNLVTKQDKLEPSDGYYLSADVDATTMSHSMQRLPGNKYEREREVSRITNLIKSY